MPGIRLHPSYHGYALDDPRLKELLARAAARKLVVQLALKLEDVRTQHRMGRVDTADAKPLVAVMKAIPDLRLVLLNALADLRPPLLGELSAAGNVWFEISALEGVGGLETLRKQVRPDRILFGSHAPFLTWDAARLKVQEAGLEEAEARSLFETNARGLIDA